MQIINMDYRNNVLPNSDTEGVIIQFAELAKQNNFSIDCSDIISCDFTRQFKKYIGRRNNIE